MSQAAPPSDKAGKPAKSPSAPPDERFWQRYSPHAELPLSSAGSLVLHILALGLLVLMAWLGTKLFNHSSRLVPVEAVVLSGGGGNPQGRGEGPNNNAEPREAENPSNDKPATDPVPNEDVPPTPIKINPDTPKQEFTEPGRQIQMEESNKTFQNLAKQAGKIRSPGSSSSSNPGYGKGSTGSGGGSGSGSGRGTGSGTGNGPDNLTQREKRQHRWNMGFNVEDTTDYISQLRGLGAILAIPVDERGDTFAYRVVRDLSARPAKLLDENINDVLRELGGAKMWVDADPKSASSVLRVLGIPIPPNVSPQKLHFAALTPERLEQKLLRLELDYLKRNHPRAVEDDIESTTFQLKKVRNGQYDPVVKSQVLNK